MAIPVRPTCFPSSSLDYLFSSGSTFEKRKELRDEAWSKEGWSRTVSKVRRPLQDSARAALIAELTQTAELATLMDASVLLPLSYSPLK